MNDSRRGWEAGHQVGAMLREERFDEALSLIESLERPLTSAELVLKGRAIQLSTGHSAQLDEAEGAFREALALDDEYVPALLELGWYYFAVADDPHQGLECFRRALALSEGAIREATEGVSRCLEETEEASSQIDNEHTDEDHKA